MSSKFAITFFEITVLVALFFSSLLVFKHFFHWVSLHHTIWIMLHGVYMLFPLIHHYNSWFCCEKNLTLFGFISKCHISLMQNHFKLRTSIGHRLGKQKAVAEKSASFCLVCAFLLSRYTRAVTRVPHKNSIDMTSHHSRFGTIDFAKKTVINNYFVGAARSSVCLPLIS